MKPTPAHHPPKHVCLQGKDKEETGPGGDCCKGWGRTPDAAASLI